MFGIVSMSDKISLKFDPIRANSMIKTQGMRGRGPGDDRNGLQTKVISVVSCE